jgi:hypothetical protein
MNLKKKEATKTLRGALHMHMAAAVTVGSAVRADVAQSVQRQGYELDDRGSIRGRGSVRCSLFVTVSRPDLGPTLPPRGSYPGGKTAIA